MNEADLAKATVERDLKSPRFLTGVMRKRWRRLYYEFPVLILAVAAVEPDGKASEYAFRFELTGFPAANPEVRIWDAEANSQLAPDRRPKGSRRVVEAFKPWGEETVYRPWDRKGGPHNNWSRDHPELAWHPQRDITFILEDLHGLLTSNILARPSRPAA